MDISRALVALSLLAIFCGGFLLLIEQVTRRLGGLAPPPSASRHLASPAPETGEGQ